MLTHKLVVGFVIVEGANYVVAIRPRILSWSVDFKAVGVGITHNIQPVLSPAFAVPRTVEQFLDELPEGFWILSRYEFRNLFRSRWQANHVKVQASDQRSPVGRH